MTVRAVAALIVLACASPAAAQAPAQGGRGAVATPRMNAPIDLTGTWVSLVTDDWRWRMVTPPKGDVLYLPVNADGRRIAEAWDPDRDEAAGEQCKAYGAPGIMALPGRIRIAWDDDATLRLDADTGTQTRVLQFGSSRPVSERTWQGHSVAAWELPGGGRSRRGASPSAATLKVVTTNLRPGYFRKNGVPYGANAVLTEYYTVLAEENGDRYLAVTRFLDDPQYLTGPYIRTVQFKRQSDAGGWNPTPCSAR